MLDKYQLHNMAHSCLVACDILPCCALNACRLLVDFGLINLGVNVVLFLYLYFWLEAIRGVAKPLLRVQWATPLGAITLVTALIR